MISLILFYSSKSYGSIYTKKITLKEFKTRGTKGVKDNSKSYNTRYLNKTETVTEGIQETESLFGDLSEY